MNDRVDYITTADAAKKAGVCTQRILALLAQHRIAGAKKHGTVWLIPAAFTVSPAKHRARKLSKIVRAKPPKVGA